MTKYSRILSIELIILILEIKCIDLKKRNKFYKEQNLLNKSLLWYKPYSLKEYKKLEQSWKILKIME